MTTNITNATKALRFIKGRLERRIAKAFEFVARKCVESLMDRPN